MAKTTTDTTATANTTAAANAEPKTKATPKGKGKGKAAPKSVERPKAKPAAPSKSTKATKAKAAAKAKGKPTAKDIADALAPKYLVALVILDKEGEVSRVNGFGTMQLRTMQAKGLITKARKATKLAGDVFKALGRKGQANARKLYNEHFADSE